MYSVSEIVSEATERRRISREESEYLLSLPEDSSDVSLLIDSAHRFVLDATGSVARIGAQIGVILGPCYADCGFCSFAASTTDTEDYVMSPSELTRYLRMINEGGKVSGISLMTIHQFDFDTLLDLVSTARSVLPESIPITINTGDLDPAECRELKSSGVDSAYHALRLDESIDNLLEPRQRLETMKNLLAAGIKVISGVEPIGPEHSPKEIMDTYWRTYDLGCNCCSASRREAVPGTRMYNSGEISERRLEQVRAALVLSSAWCDRTELGYYGGYYGGLNRALCEYGGSPKDEYEISEHGLGRTVEWAMARLRSEGFGKLLLADGSIGSL